MIATTSERLRSVALGLVIAGLLVNPWLVAYLATADATIDDVRLAAGILLIGLAGVLGGLQLMFRWVDRLSWQRPVGVLRSFAVVSLVAFIGAAIFWRMTTYFQDHDHTHVVATGHDHTTPEQEQWAQDFYLRSLAAAQKHGWFDIDNAFAEGFQPDRVNGNHFPNLKYMFDDVMLDPERPEWLVYDASPDGRVLMAMMFFTRRLEEVGPTPGGPLAQWHYHPYERLRCAVKGLWTVGYADDEGRCAEGEPVSRTPEMLHVWFIDHPLGRYSEMKIVPDYRSDGNFDPSRWHPISVHFAIALFAIAVLLDAGALVSRRPQLHWAAWVNLVLATAAVAVAVAAGMTAEIMLRPTHETHAVLDTHKLLAFGALGSIVLLAAWRYALRGQFPTRGAVLYGLVSLAGLGAVGGAGYYGGELVYTHGAGVRAINTFARERYWEQVRQVYRGGPAPGTTEHTGH